MTQSFDEWFEGNCFGFNDEPIDARAAHEAGAQSKQSEINELIETLKTSAESESYLFDELQKVNDDRDKLRRQLKKSMIAIEDGEINWALRNIKKVLRNDQ